MACLIKGLEPRICEQCWKEFSPDWFKQKKCHDCIYPPCLICWKIVPRPWYTFCSKDCRKKHKKDITEANKKKRLEQDPCPYCWWLKKEYRAKTCWSPICVRKYKQNTTKNKYKEEWIIYTCISCWKKFYPIMYNQKYCDSCINSPCIICWKPVSCWRDKTCSVECRSIYISQQYHDQLVEHAKRTILSDEAKRKVKEINMWRKWTPNLKNRRPNYKNRWPRNAARKWWVKRSRPRKSYERINILRQVYKRDDYTCQICNKKWWNLNAHHIRARSEYPELRYDTNNIVTLCENCHKEVHRLWWWTHWEKETFSIIFKLINGL